MIAISANKFTKYYAKKIVVDEIDLNISEGTVFGFLGPNGAGKTTTIRMLLGLVRPNSGTAEILGFKVKSELGKISPNIAAIVENPTFFPNLNAIQTLRTFADYCGLSLFAKDYESSLDKCGLLHASNQKVDTFSLGMRQRLGLAVALLNDPKVVFLDEPTNGLDPDGIVQTRKLIRHLADNEKKTFFISSHLLNEVELVCDDVAILNHGKVLISGSVKELLSNDRISIRATPIVESKNIINRHFPDLEIDFDETSEKIILNIGAEKVPPIIEKLVQGNISIYEVHKTSTTLEHIFHKTVNGS